MNPLKNILFLAAILGLSLSGGQQATAEAGFGLKAPHTQPSSGQGLQLVRDHGHHGHSGGMMGGMPSRQMMTPPSGGMRMAPPPGGRNLFAPRNEFSKRSFGSNEMRIRPYKPPFIGDGGPRPDRFHHRRHRRHHHGFYWYTPSYPDYYYSYDIYNYDYRSCYLNCRKYHSRRYCRTYWRRYCD